MQTFRKRRAGLSATAGISCFRWQAFRQVNFQEDAALRCSRRPSLVSLDNESQINDDDDDDDDDDNEDSNDDEEEDDFDDDRSVSVLSSAGRSEVCNDAWIDGTSTPVWYQMLHTLNKVLYGKENI